MPIAGKGMLLTSMDINASDEADFNRWYDREHLEERVAIDGFIEARRYVAEQASPKYLCLYSTETIEVLDSAAYRARLGAPTEWSKATMAQFKNMIRSVARITISKGTGRGAVLGVIRLRPKAGQDEALRRALQVELDPADLDGIISMHLLEGDAALSGPTAELPITARGVDWFVLIDGTESHAIATLMTTRFAAIDGPLATQISVGIYRLMWDLSRADITQS
ncbi:conserved hypothetical protein [Bradyrhizobium sp. STM 3843]|uniref:DUF4286 family protein n=1 Tax=Bradyrhizobium sp. STM 3843 TaxID=551947 RepID=UPI000240AE0A|nr:DUF4286 family protein [Bradyrhizobium sp. STM 3843]CCE05203.1 conserved hypothetical protein [Bradyrhizobium sp. STM 3843]